MFALERPPHLSSAALDDVKSPRIRALHDYWKSKCNDVVPPPRSAIEPAEIRPLLPYLLLTEVTGPAGGPAGDEPFRIAYRLVGTQVVRWHGEDFTGRDHGTVKSLAESGMEESYRRACATKAPVFGRSAIDAGDQSWITFEYAVFPLSDNGKTVNKCLAIECIGPTQATEGANDPDVASVGRDPRQRPLAAPAEKTESGKTSQHQRQRGR
jgi:hypothetical protein